MRGGSHGDLDEGQSQMGVEVLGHHQRNTVRYIFLQLRVRVLSRHGVTHLEGRGEEH